MRHKNNQTHAADNQAASREQRAYLSARASMRPTVLLPLPTIHTKYTLVPPSPAAARAAAACAIARCQSSAAAVELATHGFKVHSNLMHSHHAMPN